MLRFSSPEKDPGLATSVQMIFDLIRARMPTRALQVSNEFRVQYCYTESTDAALRKHETLLKAMYDVFSIGEGLVNDLMKSRRLLGFDEWRSFVTEMDLIDKQFTLVEATICFLWSRMLIVDEADPASRSKMVQLNFFDFLEAIVRVAIVKALPTALQLKMAGAEDAGQFFARLRNDPTDFDNFITRNAPEWGQPPRQPVAACVERLMECIVAKVERRSDAGGSRLGSIGKKLLQLASITRRIKRIADAQVRRAEALQAGGGAGRRGGTCQGAGCVVDHSAPSSDT